MNDYPIQLAGVNAELAARILSRPTAPELTPEEVRARRAERAERKRNEAESELVVRMGQRYTRCADPGSFDVGNDAYTDARRRAVGQVQQLCQVQDRHVANGDNLIVAGPSGGGKDHLLAGVLIDGIRRFGISVLYESGTTLFARFREAIGSSRTETSIVADYLKADVLALSDPAPPQGGVTDYSATILYRIVDGRYRAGKSTYVTINAITIAEAAKAITAPVFDRLQDAAVVIVCDWTSYRASRKPSWRS